MNGEDRMKVLVAVKRVIDYNVKVRVKADGSGVDADALVAQPVCELRRHGRCIHQPGQRGPLSSHCLQRRAWMGQGQHQLRRLQVLGRGHGHIFLPT